MWRAWERERGGGKGGRCLLNEIWVRVRWRVADSRWRDRGYRASDLVWIVQRKMFGFELCSISDQDWRLMPDSSDARTSYQCLKCFTFLSLSLSACLSASSLNFFSLDYQHCNWVKEPRGPATRCTNMILWESIRTLRTNCGKSRKQHTLNWHYKMTGCMCTLM